MRALITGGAGFIGSHLVDLLLSKGWQVVVVDDFSACEPDNLPPSAPVFNCLQYARAFSAPLTIFRTRLTWSELVEMHSVLREQPDVVFHLAARIGVGQILDDPVRMLREHAEDTLGICEFANRWKAVLVVASTSEVYGPSEAASLREDQTLAIGPSQIARSGYAVSKLYEEHVALGYARQYGLRAVVPRLFNVAGPRQRAEKGCVIPRFCRAAVAGDLLYVHGDGLQARSFGHVADVVRALYELSQCEAAYGQIVNVGQPVARTILQVAETIAAYCRSRWGVSPRIEQVPLYKLPADAGWKFVTYARVPCVEKLERLLGWVPADRWNEIVEHTCAYWRFRMPMDMGEENRA